MPLHYLLIPLGWCCRLFMSCYTVEARVHTSSTRLTLVLNLVP